MPTNKKTTSNFFICFTLLFLTQGKALSKTCRIEQTHITLGDFFTWSKNEENFYTISTIVRGENCDPKVKIYNGLQKIATYSPSSTIEYSNEEKLYSAVSSKFLIPKNFSTSNLTWKIKTTDDSEGMNIFPAAPQSADSTANWAVFGDMDISPSSQPFIDLAQTFDSKDIDGLIHIGDFAYNVQSKNGKRGDKFFQAMTDSFSKNIPYLVIAGNHEAKYEGKFFDFRFRMPGVDQSQFRGNHYYSFIYKGIHYTAIDWDYVFNLTGGEEIHTVLKWLENELKNAENDHLINFKVFLSHRPFYCPQVTGDHCKIFYHLRPFEMILRKYRVDLYLMAHEHKYYRFKKQEDFVNKEGAAAEELPLMIVSGAIGCEDGQASLPGIGDKNQVEKKVNGQVIIDGMTDFMYLTKKSAWLKIRTSPFSIEGFFMDSQTREVLDKFEVKRREKKSDKSVDIF